MSAASVARRITTDPKTQDAIEHLLERHRFTDRECEAVLVLVETYLEGFTEAGGSVNEEVTIRAGAKGTDNVWAMRVTRGVTT